MRRWLYLTAVVPALLFLALLNIRAYLPGDEGTVLAQLRFLGNSLQSNGGERMQQIFPEGYVFTWALYGLASTQAAQGLPEENPGRAELLERSLSAIDHVVSSRARSIFPDELDPPGGAFYNSWSLYLRANYIRAAGVNRVPSSLLLAFESDCDAFSGALERSPNPFLQSYPGAAWPADVCGGIAALSIHDRIARPRYASVIQHWVEKARRRLDPGLHALSHAADASTGAPSGGVRGSSLALMSRVLVEASPDLAREQYAVLRNQFVDYQWGVPGIREFPKGKRGRSDIDSGPLVLGYSGPAVVVGSAAARIHGDESLARALLGAVEVAGLPVEWRGARRYAGGALPLGDAFVAWARSTPPSPEPVRWTRTIPWWWRFPAHALSLAIAVLLLLPAVTSVARKRDLSTGDGHSAPRTSRGAKNRGPASLPPMAPDSTTTRAGGPRVPPGL